MDTSILNIPNEHLFYGLPSSRAQAGEPLAKRKHEGWTDETLLASRSNADFDSEATLAKIAKIKSKSSGKSLPKTCRDLAAEIVNDHIGILARKPSFQIEKDISDSLSEASLALLSTIFGFNPSESSNFGTYAIPIAEQKMVYFSKTSLVDKKGLIDSTIYHYNLALFKLSNQLGYRANDSELCQVLGIDENVFQKIKAKYFHGITSFEDLGNDNPEEPLDYYQPASGHGHFTDSYKELGLLDDLSSVDYASFFDEIFNSNDKNDIRERIILTLHLGLHDNEALSFKEIGAQLACSRENVRKRYNNALRKVMHGLGLYNPWEDSHLIKVFSEAPEQVSSKARLSEKESRAMKFLVDNGHQTLKGIPRTSVKPYEVRQKLRDYCNDFNPSRKIHTNKQSKRASYFRNIPLGLQGLNKALSEYCSDLQLKDKARPQQ